MIDIRGTKVAKVLEFEATQGFGRWREFFPEDAVAHPAKMNCNLLSYLIEHYSLDGETILDPMAGSGSTGVIAALNGRNAILIEMEEKFCGWIREAVGKVEAQNTLEKKGKIVVIQGDARNIPLLFEEHRAEITSEISGTITSPPYGNRLADRRLKDDEENGRMKYSTAGAENKENIGFLTCDSVLFSPPYASSFKYNAQDKEKRIRRLIEVEKKNVESGKKWSVSSKEAIERQVDRQDGGYGSGDGNIGNLPYLDAVITSPPYSLGHDSGDKASGEYAERLKEQRKHTRAYSDGNIARLQPDAVIFSPPYENSLHDTTEKRLTWSNTCDQAKADKGVPVGYSENLDNIGNLKFSAGDRAEAEGGIAVNDVITSPPYFDTKSDWDETSNARREGETVSYSDERNVEKENIGNVHYYDEGEPLAKKYSKANGKETYLEAMQKVYSGCFAVLKTKGRMVVVVKDFIRNYQVVRLHDHTRSLCERCGFVFDEMLAFRLPQKSFWRTLYAQKYGDRVKDIELLDYEFVIVLHKP